MRCTRFEEHAFKKHIGATCATSDECCTDLECATNTGKCRVPLGGRCDNDLNCGTRDCRSFVCTCQRTGANCYDSSDCCLNARCVNSKCAPQQAGEQCRVDEVPVVECVSDYYCIDNVCQR